MKTYHVYFRSDLQWGRKDIEAETPAQALERARQLAETDDHMLLDDYFEHTPINEIEICDAEHDELALWQDDDLLLRLAARDLLEAAELVVARWERGDLAEAVRGLDSAIAKAKGDAA
jgi:hypothetical protein